MENAIFVSGNCASDPRYFGEGKGRVCKVSILVDRPKAKDAENSAADLIPVTMFGNNADFAERCVVKKGTNITVRGRFTTGSYTNKDGQTVYTKEVTAEPFGGLEVIREGNLKKNRALIRGRLVADPEERTTQDGTAISKYRVAIDRPMKAKEGEEKETDFPSIIAYGKAAEFANAYFRKGMYVDIEGRIRSGSYEGKDGTKVYTLDVLADRQEFCQKKSANEKSSDPAAPAAPADSATEADDSEFVEFTELDEDDLLPFD